MTAIMMADELNEAKRRTEALETDIKALQLAGDVLTRASSVSRAEPLLIVLSDGRANVGIDAESAQADPWRQSLERARMLAKKGFAALVLDTEVGFVRLGRARELAAALGAQCLALEEFNSESLMLTIRSQQQRA